MKKLFSTTTDHKAVNIWLLVFRIFIASLMLTHGVPKLMHLVSGDEIKFISFLGMSPATSMSLTVFAELFCSILILIGFATRLAAIPLIINMSVALLVAHSHDPFRVKELALVYLVLFVGFLILGGGKYSLDYFLYTGNKKTKDNNH